MFDWSGFAVRLADGTASPLDALPALGALSEQDLLDLDQDSAQAVIETTQAAQAALGAAQALAVEAFTRREEDSLERFRDLARAHHQPIPGVTAEDVVPAMLAPAFHLAPRTMHTLLYQTRILVNHLPTTLALARAGRLEMTRARAVAAEAGLIDPCYRRAFEDALHAKDITRLAPAALRHRAARAALRVDPASATERARTARDTREVTLRPDEPGMSTWYARQPSETSIKAWAAIDALAAEYARANPALTIAQARADAMMDLLLGQATITATIDLVLPAPTPTDPADPAPTDPADPDATDPADPDATDPGSVSDGPGPQPAHRDPAPEPSHQPPTSPAPAPSPVRTYAWMSFADLKDAAFTPTCLIGAIHHRGGVILNEHLTALLADPDTRIRLHTADRDTGQLSGHDPTTYRPGARLARAVRSRDGTCRFPGCATPATRCQLDHVTPFPHGPTAITNLTSLCTSHHGFKHHAGWTLTMTPDGICTWTSPQHRSYTTRPQDHRDLAA